MRYILVFATLLLGDWGFFCLQSRAQEDEFQVLKILNGKIIVAETGATLKRGDVILIDDILHFSTDSTEAALFNPEKGLFVLRPTKVLGGSTRAMEDEFWAKENMQTLQTVSLSRSQLIQNERDLLAHFSEGQYFIFGGSIKLIISPKYLPLGPDKYFMIKYVHQGQTIEKRLPYQQDTLFIIQDSIFQSGNTRINAQQARDFEIFYYDTHQKTAQKLSHFFPVFLNDAQLEQEIGPMIRALQARELSAEALADNIIAYFNEFYEARPVKPDVMDWLLEKYGIR
ncbi:MAG: hypothetical protein OHK0053_06680 [Microscillaceae bacterium]